MGLAGRKVKQRIGHDPRNLSWADDASKFGAAYLSKLGWDASAGVGLGPSGEGRTSHIKVNQKLDMLGIGAAHQKDPNGIAWKQNRDFENLLKRLNANGAGQEGDAQENSTVVDGFVRANSGAGEETANQEAKASAEEHKTKKKKKKSKKKSELSETEDRPASESAIDTPSTSDTKPQPRVALPHRAHRSRFIASKRLSSKSAAAIDEILGISRSGTSTPHPGGPSTPLETTEAAIPSAQDDELKLQELKTSSKSVMDYFKEKLLAKSNAKSGLSQSVTPASAPRDDDGVYDDYADRPRAGLGLGAARLKLPEEDFTGGGRMGLGASSRLSAMFSTAAASSSLAGTSDAPVGAPVAQEVVLKEKGPEESEKKKSKKDKKDKKRKRDAEEIERKFEEGEMGEVEQSEKKEEKKKKHKKRNVDEDENATGEVVHAAEDGGGSMKKEKSRKKKRKEATNAGEDEPQPAASAELDVGHDRKGKKDKKVNRRAQEPCADLYEEADERQRKKRRRRREDGDTDS